METINATAAAEAGLAMTSLFTEAARAPKFRYELECRGADGELKWTEDVTNLVTTEGGNDLLDKYFKGSAYTAAWFMGLAGAGTKAAGAGLAAVAAYASPWTEAASPGATFLDQLVGSATTYDDVVTESASAGSAWATSGVTAAQVSEAAGAGEQVASSAWLAEQLAEVAAGDDLVIGAQLFAETLDEAAAAAELLLEQLVPAIPENADRALLLAFSTRARPELGLQVPTPFAIGFTSRDPAPLTLAARPAAALSLQPRSAALDLGS